MCSDFADKEKHAGVVPAGNYFALVYKRCHKTIRTFLSKEVKKRDSRQLSWDVSYKVNKKMCQCHGQAVSFYTHAFATFVIVDACIVTNMLCHSVLLHHLQVFKGLVTATNEYGEIRIQFYVVTDGHDQMESAIQAFLATTNACGQRPLNLVFSDNPTADDEWFKSQIPSIQASQDRLDEAASTENDGGAGAGLPSVDLSQVTVSRGAASINTSSAAVQSLIGNNGSSAAVSIDAEWRMLKNSYGYIVGPDKMAVITVACSDPEGDTVRVHIFQVYEFKGRSLPVQLMNLIADERTKKVGVNVGGDLAKIGRDFNCQDEMSAVPDENIINLGLYARRRDVVQNGPISLAELSRIVLGKEMAKDNGARISDWTRRDLSDEQKRHCYEDGKAGIDIYNALKDLPDLSARISPEAATPGTIQMSQEMAFHLC